MQVLEKKQLDPGIFQALNYNSLEEAGVEMLYLAARNKLSEYMTEKKIFEQKYKTTFDNFKERLESEINNEDFAEEDDLMAWRFCHEHSEYWVKKVKELELCL